MQKEVDAWVQKEGLEKRQGEPTKTEKARETAVEPAWEYWVSGSEMQEANALHRKKKLEASHHQLIPESSKLSLEMRIVQHTWGGFNR